MFSISNPTRLVLRILRHDKPKKNLGELSRLPIECKEKFMELKKEQGVILHDSLEQKERYVCKLLASAES